MKGRSLECHSSYHTYGVQVTKLEGRYSVDIRERGLIVIRNDNDNNELARLGRQSSVNKPNNTSIVATETRQAADRIEQKVYLATPYSVKNGVRRPTFSAKSLERRPRSVRMRCSHMCMIQALYPGIRDCALCSGALVPVVIVLITLHRRID
jgi:hypothetical protein